MPPGFLTDDTTRQQDALAAAWTGLADTLDTLAVEARTAAKAARRRRPNPDLDRVRAALRDFDQAENARDTAAYDLSTARGEHG